MSSVGNSSEPSDQNLGKFQATLLADDADQPQRGRADKGLPDAQALHALAATYLELQNKFWPEWAKEGRIPKASKKAIETYAEDFRRRYLSNQTEPQRCQPRTAVALGVVYTRFSCDHSNPRSLAQQLRNALERADRDRIFIPWEHVCADAAVTGTIANRCGYKLAKALITANDRVKVLYLDEIGRASRDTIESLQLGRLSARSGCRLVGISDSFDSELPGSKQWLSFLATNNETFVDHLRQRVDRGMRDAFNSGKNIRPAAFGYFLEPVVGADGQPVINHKGKVEKEKKIDPTTGPWVAKIFDLFVNRRQSPDQIARLLNEQRVGDRANWDRSRLIPVLERRTYVGIEYDHMTQKVADPETGRVKIVARPQSEWRRRDVPHLRIVTDELFAKAQELIGSSDDSEKRKRRSPSRTEKYPKQLFRPYCGYCGQLLWLGRSGKYAHFCCLNGTKCKKGCKLRSYKSVSIVENAILDYIKTELFTDDFLQDLIEKANTFLKAELRRPREDLAPLRAAISKRERKCKRLSTVISNELEKENANESELRLLVKQLRTDESDLHKMRTRLAEAEVTRKTPKGKLTLRSVKSLLSDLRKLLSGDVGAAAPVLRELTGPIKIEQVTEPNQRSATWIARFSLNAVPAMLYVAAKNDCPSRGILEYLNGRSWTMGAACSVRLEKAWP